MEPPPAFVVELAPGWKRWAKDRSDAELSELRTRLAQLQEGFGKPHLHAGLGLRRLSTILFEFRLSRAVRVLFSYHKPNTIRLQMIGSHDDVRRWLKEND